MTILNAIKIQKSKILQELEFLGWLCWQCGGWIEDSWTVFHKDVIIIRQEVMRAWKKAGRKWIDARDVKEVVSLISLTDWRWVSERRLGWLVDFWIWKMYRWCSFLLKCTAQWVLGKRDMSSCRFVVIKSEVINSLRHLICRGITVSYENSEAAVIDLG